MLDYGWPIIILTPLYRCRVVTITYLAAILLSLLSKLRGIAVDH